MRWLLLLMYLQSLTQQVINPFNVVLIAEEQRIYLTEENLSILPDFTFTNSPKLNVLVVPSSMSPENQTSNSALVNFIKEKSKSAEFYCEPLWCGSIFIR